MATSQIGQTEPVRLALPSPRSCSGSLPEFTWGQAFFSLKDLTPCGCFPVLRSSFFLNKKYIRASCAGGGRLALLHILTHV